MTEFTWPDEAIDAAAKALMEDSARTWDEAWDELPKAARKEWRRYATGALSALTPFVSAMLDEAVTAQTVHLLARERSLSAAGRRLAEALREIRDHGKTDEFPCHDFAGGADCVDLMQERARAVLAECPWKGKPDA